jgi:transposase
MTMNLLNLPDFKVQRVEESDHDYHVYAEASNTPRACGYCGSSRLIGHGRNEQVIRDLPTHGKRLAIYVDTRRWRCQNCGKTFMETLPAVNAKREMTDRLVKWIGQQSLKRTFASIADDTGLDEKTIRNIFRDYVNELEAQFRFETPKWMGIDEIHLIRPRCVISNIGNNTIVNMLPNRDKKTVVNYLYQLEGKREVQYVAMDMWTPYRDAVQTVLPDARIVIDKFHVVRMANDALEKVRKGLREQLTPKQRRGLMHDRFVLLKRERDLNDQELLLLDGWTRNYPELGAAYRLKEDFCAIYEQSTNQRAAIAAYEDWSKAVVPEVRDAFSDLIRAFTNWQPFILNYFEHPVTNAYTESLNSLIRVMNRLGRGYNFEALRAKILFTEGAHKKSLAKPKFERRRPAETLTTGYDLPPGRLARSFAIPMNTGWRAEEPQQQYEQPKNFGADITTLIALLESGQL